MAGRTATAFGGEEGSPDGRPALVRLPDQGIFGGVCAGIARASHLDVRVVRLAMALAVAVGGIGFAIYVLTWALTPVAPESAGVSRPPGTLLRAALVLVALALTTLAVRLAGLRFGDSVVWPLLVGTMGIALAWRVMAGTGPLLGGSGGAGGLRAMRARVGYTGVRRLVLAALLVAFASSALLHAFGVLHNFAKEAGAVAIIATTLGLLVGPWAVRLGRTLTTERAARIREQERAELAAHLHDSVLQTLALIQKRAGDPRAVAGLARRQERELRGWLLGRFDECASDSAKAALERAAAEVEELHGVPIEVVVVGERSLDSRLEALVAAAREAMTNAAKFAGSDRVDLYAELGQARAEVFVRDRGAGFDPDAIPPDRHGVRESIVGRVQRHRGRALISSAPGKGTEVELVMEGAPAS